MADGGSRGRESEVEMAAAQFHIPIIYLVCRIWHPHSGTAIAKVERGTSTGQ
jgi:hypothetical protein